MNRTWLISATVAVILLALFLFWLFKESSKPLPGEKIADLGRGHVPIGTQVGYTSNPPTSGKHYEGWIKAGVYESPKDDRNLVHSLEHGYVIMHYKCSIQAIEQSSNQEATESAEEIATSPSTIAQDPRNDEGECKSRRDQLAKIYEKKGKRKLIVVPRENLETNFAISAWTYLDKFNDFDSSRIEKFIDVHRDQGPEKTME